MTRRLCLVSAVVGVLAVWCALAVPAVADECGDGNHCNLPGCNADDCGCGGQGAEADPCECDEDCPCPDYCPDGDSNCHAKPTKDCECQDNEEWQQDRCDHAAAETCETVCDQYERQQTCSTVDIVCDCGYESCPNSDGETTSCRQEHWCTRHPNKPPAGFGECYDESMPCDCTNGQFTCHEEGGCTDVCCMHEELPCGDEYNEDCACSWLDCSDEGDCANPTCASKPYKCIQATCWQGPHGEGCLAEFCPCDMLCINNNSGWGCGGLGHAHTCDCAGLNCTAWCGDSLVCENGQCPSGGPMVCVLPGP